jgi:imidazolonepropionase-like amidohydrolase
MKPSRLLVTAETLVHPGGETVRDCAVVVEGELIVWVGEHRNVPLEFTESRHLDLGNVTLLPGLIDAHVHLNLGSEPSVDGDSDGIVVDDEADLATMLSSARELVEVGVTTARDLGGRGYLALRARDAINAGVSIGPRILAAGPPLTPPLGHCWFLGGEVDGTDEALQLVQAHVEAGVDVIKVMATGGFLTPGTMPWDASFEETTFRAIVDESHRLGRRVAAHCHGVEGIKQAIAAGVDTLEHCSFMEEGGGSAVDDSLVEAIARSGAYVSPTMNADARLLMSRGWKPPVVELWRRGARVIASTDAGIPGTPHRDYVLALEALVDAGIPDSEVLVAATVTAAEALDLEGITGRVVAGYAADLIAVNGDPSQDIRVLHKLRFVMARGTLVPLRADPQNRIREVPRAASV